MIGQAAARGAPYDRRAVAVPVVIAAVLHILMLAWDVHAGFPAFLTGDRAPGRWIELEIFAHSTLGTIAAWAQCGVPPAELAIVYPAYFVAGKAGIVVFQVALALASVAGVADIARRTLNPRAAIIAATLYALLPQNLCFPHQFVSEASATPLVTGFLYAILRFSESRRTGWLVAAGIALGLATFIRISLFAILPAFVVLWIALPTAQRRERIRQAVTITAIALAPMLLWMGAFKASTGHWGYTSSIITTSWNLRSKVFLVSTRNGIPLPPEVAAYDDYHDFDQLPGGISSARFVDIAKRDPLAYAKAGLVDSVITWTRGNTSKLMVDYLRASPDAIKEWRGVLDHQGALGLVRWGLQRPDTTLAFGLEIVASVFTALLVAAAAVMTAITLMRPRAVAAALGDPVVRVIATIAAVAFATEIAALVIDQAQGRLRNPAESGLVLAAAYLIAWRRHRAGAQAS